MHVDGFRFDLASALARELHEVDRLSAFFDLIQQDPVVSQVKLIAEPWDVGEGGYQVGNFPALWSEWNGKYRDTVRDFWRGEHATLGEFASRFTGSSDLYQGDGRRPSASINFVTAHDGFTLRDLVSYNEKHNEANGEDNRDGESHNRSWNCGVEGETDDPAVNQLRRRQQRNFLATLLLSQGVPMILAGDEMGRTQRGQQQRLLPGQRDLVARLVSRRTTRTCSRSSPASPPSAASTPCSAGAAGSSAGPCEAAGRQTSPGSPPTAARCPRRTGTPASPSRWPSSSTAPPSPTPTPGGSRITDDSFLVCFNGHHEEFALHGARRQVRHALGRGARHRQSAARHVASPTIWWRRPGPRSGAKASRSSRATTSTSGARSVVVLRRVE